MMAPIELGENLERIIFYTLNGILIVGLVGAAGLAYWTIKHRKEFELDEENNKTPSQLELFDCDYSRDEQDISKKRGLYLKF